MPFTRMQELSSHVVPFTSIWDVPLLEEAVPGPTAAANSSSGNGSPTPSAHNGHEAHLAGSAAGAGVAADVVHASAGQGAAGRASHASVDGTCPVGTGSMHSSLDEPAAPRTGAPPPMFGGALHGREFSTWKFRSGGESKRVIDHMWWTSGRGLRPLSRWRMLNESEIGEAGLPCERYASDHIALCCEFEWVPPGPVQ